MHVHALKQDSSRSKGEKVILYNESSSAEINAKFIRHLFQAAIGSSQVKFIKSDVLTSRQRPKVRRTKIFDLSSDLYKLKRPIDIRLEIFSDETLSIIPELELYGEGNTEADALEDIKAELIDLYEYLNTLPEEKLGADPKSWKKFIDSLIID